MARIIGLAGFMGSGKSEAARQLERRGYARIPLAQAVRVEAMHLLWRPWLWLKTPPSIVFWVIACLLAGHVNPWKKPTPKPMRKLLQGIGSWRRSKNADYWVDAWEKAALASGKDVCVDDVRFDNEVNRIRFLGGRVVVVRNPLVEPTSQHESEKLPFRSDDYFDGVVVNDGTIDQLRERVNEETEKDCESTRL